MDDSIKQEILNSIELVGHADTSSADTKLVIGGRGGAHQILDCSNGLPKIRSSIIKQFKLLLSVPNSLKAMNHFSIKCSLCGRVISYPAWYYKAQFAVNVIHYFICFDESDSSKPTARCYRKD